MPLMHFIPALLRIVSHPKSPLDPAPSSSLPSLHTLLQPLLLTPRSSSEKYQSHICQILADDGGAGDAEETMMWYALRYEKMDDERSAKLSDDQAPDADEEKWRHTWLGGMERREVQIQILLHLLLLSQSGPSQPGEVEPVRAEIPVQLMLSPSKRKRKQRDPSLRPLPLEEGLEFFMDKLSMWQLMASLEEEDAKRHVYGKGKQRAVDDRDWIQVFCEDIVEPLFKDKQPDLCALLHTKVFQASAFSDDADSFTFSPSPPSSPRLKPAATASSQSSHGRNPPPQVKTSDRLRSRSLSVSLEQERSRSRSASVDAAGLRKRMFAREVSMSTVFKGKNKDSKTKASTARTRVGRAPQEKPAPVVKEKRKGRESAFGMTLVAATPTKPRVKSQSQREAALAQPAFLQQRDRARALRLKPLAEGPVEGDGSNDQWMLPSSPDVLLMGPDGDDDTSVLGKSAKGRRDGAGSRRMGSLLVTSTPTKKARIGI
ncbi:hypothetical protein SCP_0805180 [Sparassis crispa]|uniref:DNA replication regulator Sld3 C-terminal domain-containing protein n=1 Tax=Sparassis crispa TaxID=139825 RepID=A0A401GW52_9APHY|nr:hypothetical protein SCP_0805180 [Sparassis crispa]GBE85994.1 hypothetical protein SCP_0805180 [Sparassis crispa]